MSLSNEPIQINEIARDVYERARTTLGDKPVIVELIEQCHLGIEAPPAVVGIILTNLVGNACQYTDRGKVTITVVPEGVRITDTGCGMDADTLSRVFDPFFRGGDGSKPGYGVGLTIVRRLSDRFHWPVVLTSEPGVGTSALLKLPGAKAA